MNQVLKKKYLFLKWFFVIIIVESTILISILNDDLFLIKILINYLFLIALIPFIYEKIRNGKIDIFSPIAIFTFFYLLLFGIRALDLVLFRKEIILLDQKYYSLAIFYAIIGLHFFQFGYFIKLRSKLIDEIKEKKIRWSIKRLRLISVIIMAISVLSFVFIVEKSGGFFLYFKDIRNAMVGITSGSTYIFLLIVIIQIPIVVLFCSLINTKQGKAFFLLYFLAGVLLLISLGERGHFVSLIISLLACYHYLNNKIKFSSIVLFSSLIILFIIVFGKYRDFTERLTQRSSSKFKLNLSVNQGYNYFIGHFDQLKHVKDVLKEVPEELNFQYGKTYLNFLVKPIPSAFWQGKPQGAGSLITKSIYPKAFSLKVTVAPSMLAELYLNFHIIGITLGLLFFGILLGYFKDITFNNRNINLIVLYSISLPYFFSELRGDFSVVTSFMLFKFIVLFVFLKFISFRSVEG